MLRPAPPTWRRLGLTPARWIDRPLNSPPRTATQLNERLAQHAIDSTVDVTTAQLLRSLSAMRDGGHFLLAGERAAPYAGWVLDGMDINARMVIVLPERFDRTVVQPCFDIDLRVSGHVQDIAAFLHDVAAYRFALVALDLDEVSDDVASALATDLVAPGGSLLVLAMQADGVGGRRGAMAQERVDEWFDANWVVTALTSSNAILATRRAVPVNRRRGGRRAQKANRRTSLL